MSFSINSRNGLLRTLLSLKSTVHLKDHEPEQRTRKWLVYKSSNHSLCVGVHDNYPLNLRINNKPSPLLNITRIQIHMDFVRSQLTFKIIFLNTYRGLKGFVPCYVVVTLWLLFSFNVTQFYIPATVSILRVSECIHNFVTKNTHEPLIVHHRKSKNDKRDKPQLNIKIQWSHPNEKIRLFTFWGLFYFL